MANGKWYSGTGGERKTDKPVNLPISLLNKHTDPAGYLADPGLVDAVNVALHLGQPLLLTGQPGTGKTQLAYSLAWELGYGTPLKFETKSTSVSRDLFYTYDTLGRFHAAQTGEGTGKALDYIRFNALGRAILQANSTDKVADLLNKPGTHQGNQRSLVLIDEIDKAPRDFPNDLLNEVENMYFRVPELGNISVSAPPEFRPVIVITSNSEKHVSDAFLRRCVFYDLPFPTTDILTRIVHSRLGETIAGNGELLKNALDIFGKLREQGTGVNNKPSTGEFLAWLQVLVAQSGDDMAFIKSTAMIEPALSALIKTSEDRLKARVALEEWVGTQQT